LHCMKGSDIYLASFTNTEIRYFDKPVRSFCDYHDVLMKLLIT
jgi:hypothetical protein